MGGWGTWGAFSFYPTKNLGTAGDGGALVSDDADVLEKAGLLRNYGQAERYHHRVVGLNSRLDEIHAALLSARLAWLDAFTERRRAVAERYRSEIDNPLVSPLAPPAAPDAHVHHLFVVTSPERERLARHLREHDVQTLIHYPVPVHEQEPCRTMARDPEGLAAAERHARECLSIPCHPAMEDDEVSRVVEAVNGFS